MSAALPATPPLRLLRVVEAVQRLGSVAAAAAALHLSVSAASRAVQQAEALLGQPLFERGPRGMRPTPAAALLSARVRRALAGLQQAGGSRLAQRASDPMLAALLAVAEARSVSGAAGRLGLSQPALSQQLRQLAHVLRQPPTERTRSGLRLTESGERVLQAMRLARAELRAGDDELALLRGDSAGRVALGALPMSTDVLVPRALTRLIARRAGLTVTVADGTYEALARQLRQGELDLLVGPLRGAEVAADLCEDLLFVDRLLPVVRAAHPLARPRRRAPPLRGLLRWPWLAPLPGTPARAAFERAFVRAGLPVPTVALQANSPALVRAMLLADDRIAMVSAWQVRADVASGLLVMLPHKVSGTERAIGITRRRDAQPTPTVVQLLAALREVAAEIAPPPQRPPGS